MVVYIFLNYFLPESNSSLRKDHEKSYKKFVNLSKKQNQLLRGTYLLHIIYTRYLFATLMQLLFTVHQDMRIENVVMQLPLSSLVVISSHPH